MEREKGFGSSDAELIARYSMGILTETLAVRVSEIKGLIEVKETGLTRKMALGVETEQAIAEKLLQLGSGVHNPLYTSKERSNDKFIVKNHIDFEVVTNKMLWLELKTTTKPMEECLYHYRYQLQWHNMLLREKATSEGYEGDLFLVVYNPETGKTDTAQVGWNAALQEDIDKGLALIYKNWDGINFTERSELPIEAIPNGVALHEQLALAVAQINKYNQMLDNLKAALCEYMEQTGTKVLRSDTLTITYFPETKKISFDSKRFKAENPELYERYRSESTSKPYVKIVLNNTPRILSTI